MLGKNYLGARDDAKKRKKGVKFLRMAADDGHTDAQYEFATWRFSIRADDEEGQKYLKYAADAGHTHAAFDLGNRLYAQVDAGAVRYFQIAVEKSHGGAQNALGWCHQHGIGVLPDLQNAFKLYKQAAKGDGKEPWTAWAQLHLGECY